jgi:predicted ATPase
MAFLASLKLQGFLSFPPDSTPIDLTPLNVLIGPNGSGKSNLIEAIEVLHATPTALATLVREGGTAQEWLWKGDPIARSATVEAITTRHRKIPSLRYSLRFAPASLRMEVLDEVIEEPEKRYPNEKDVVFYYRFQHGHPALKIRDNSGNFTRRKLKREELAVDESVLSQRKDPDIYPEVTWIGQQFARIQLFRDWTFGRSAPLRRSQPSDLPPDVLVANSENLGLILNELQHTDASTEFNRILTRFLPRFQRFSTRIQGNAVQFYLHEEGMKTPFPATRLSDGTIRFMAILALLLSPSPPPLICIEEPELGLHPDAVSLLADLFVAASDRTQLIITTHSDALVSGLTDHANSVLVCEHRGGTRVDRVDPGKLKDWLDKYRLGEIWRIGELGGNP